MSTTDTNNNEITPRMLLDGIEAVKSSLGAFETSVAKQIGEVKGDIKLHNDQLERILGNGQPGELQKLEDEIRKRPSRQELQPFIVTATKLGALVAGARGAWWFMVKLGAAAATIAGLYFAATRG